MMRIPIFGRHPDIAIDPVSNMEVDMNKPNGGTHEHEGETYYFCAPGCRNYFAKEPEKYLDPSYKGHM